MHTGKLLFPILSTFFLTAKCELGASAYECDVQGLQHIEEANNGSCFYMVRDGKPFIFNSSEAQNQNLQQINFQFHPTSPYFDVELKIKCSTTAKMNITVKTKAKDTEDRLEKLLLSGLTCNQTYETKFSKTEYHFGTENKEGKVIPSTTFSVHVYGFQSPIWLESWYSQNPVLRVSRMSYYIVTAVCFLMIVGAIMWKVKQVKNSQGSGNSEIHQESL